jgi:hypothetical protein
VRYVIAAPPLTVRTCWRRYCQYVASGSGAVNATFLAEAVTIEGETSDYRSIADSGNVMHRRFCPTCGIQLFSTAEARNRRARRNDGRSRTGSAHDDDLGRPRAALGVL